MSNNDNVRELIRYEVWMRYPIDASGRWTGWIGCRNNYMYLTTTETEKDCIEQLEKKIARWKKRNKANEFKIVKIRQIRIVEDMEL